MTVSAADSQKQRGQTLYHVFVSDPTPKPSAGDEQPKTDPRFRLIGENIAASNAAQAVRTYVTSQKPPTGTSHLIAIPARSWKALKVVIEQTTVVKVGEPA